MSNSSHFCLRFRSSEKNVTKHAPRYVTEQKQEASISGSLPDWLLRFPLMTHTCRARSLVVNHPSSLATGVSHRQTGRGLVLVVPNVCYLIHDSNKIYSPPVLLLTPVHCDKPSCLFSLSVKQLESVLTATTSQEFVILLVCSFGRWIAIMLPVKTDINIINQGITTVI